MTRCKAMHSKCRGTVVSSASLTLNHEPLFADQETINDCLLLTQGGERRQARSAAQFPL